MHRCKTIVVSFLLLFPLLLTFPSLILAQTFALSDFIAFQDGDERRFIEFEAGLDSVGLGVRSERVAGREMVDGTEATVVESGDEREYFVIDAEGLKLLRQEEEGEEDGSRQVTVFEPPLLVLPSVLEIGRSVTHRSAFIHTHTEDGEQEAGTVTIRTTPLRMVDSLSLPAGTFERALLVEESVIVEIDAGAEEIENSLTLLAAGVGVVAGAVAEVEFGEEEQVSVVETYGFELLDATIAGNIFRPLTLSAQINGAEFTAGQTVQIQVDTRTIAAPISVDLYVALVFPDGRFATFTQDGSFSAFGSVVSNRSFLRVSSQVFQQRLSFQVSDQFPAGTYTIFVVLTPTSASVFDGDNWVALQTATFSINL